MEDWRLIKKIKSLNLEEKVFTVDELEKSEKHEQHIEKFKKELEDMDHEIYKIVGHQFITSDGVYRIAHKSEIEYGD